MRTRKELEIKLGGSTARNVELIDDEILKARSEIRLLKAYVDHLIGVRRSIASADASAKRVLARTRRTSRRR
jgi:hypothetical protein